MGIINPLDIYSASCACLFSTAPLLKKQSLPLLATRMGRKFRLVICQSSDWSKGRHRAQDEPFLTLPKFYCSSG